MFAESHRNWSKTKGDCKTILFTQKKAEKRQHDRVACEIGVFRDLFYISLLLFFLLFYIVYFGIKYIRI